MSVKAKFKGIHPVFHIIGEASKINLSYVEPAVSSSVYPVVSQVGFEQRLGKGLLVSSTMSALGSACRLITRQNQFETIFLHKKTKYPVLHLKPEREYGYVMNYLDVKVSNLPRARECFTYESYKETNLDNPAYLFTDYDEIDLPEENIPKLIREAPGPVYVSTRKRNLALYEGAQAVIISENDFKHSKNLVSNLIVTLAEDGASFNDKIYPVEKQETGDNLGCRETFFAVFSFAHFYTEDYVYSITQANKAASQIAKHRSLPKLDVGYFKALGKEILEYSVSR